MINLLKLTLVVGGGEYSNERFEVFINFRRQEPKIVTQRDKGEGIKQTPPLYF